MSDKKRKGKGLSTWIEFTQIGLQMGVIISIGVLLGVWLDEKYPNNYHIFSVSLSLFSVFASLYLVIKKVLKMAKKEEKSDES